MRFIYAKDLKKKYETWGGFYKIEGLNSEKTIYCRNILEIYYKEDIKKLRMKNSPNVIFIMMNPGISEPIYIKDKNNICTMNKNDIIENQSVVVDLVKAKPDITQYQLMRIMESKQWRHVRVINLSDYKEPKSCEFYKVLKKLGTNEVHSIFSKYRKYELEKVIETTKIVAAWGIDNELDGLIRQAIDTRMIDDRIGKDLDGGKKYYRHASPHLKTAKINWLEHILEHLGE